MQTRAKSTLRAIRRTDVCSRRLMFALSAKVWMSIVVGADRARLLALAEQNAAAAEQNRLWHLHFARTMPPGRARRSRLWLLSYHGRKAREHAEFWRRFAGVAP
jgi:hypothetical protein